MDLDREAVGTQLDEIDAALTSAERADDDREVARLLAAGAHAALRRGDVPRARGFADRNLKRFKAQNLRAELVARLYRPDAFGRASENEITGL